MTGKQPAPAGTFNYPTAYRIGCGRVAELGPACKELGMRWPLIITDEGIVGLPWFSSLRDRLADDGVEHAVFSGVDPNPVEQNVIDGVAAYREGSHDGCVLIGGGSAMDAGKCVALMVDHPGSVFDYEDVGDNWKKIDVSKLAPTVAVPTTSGTGSEVGRCSAIVQVRDHSKRLIFHPRLLPPLVIADPVLTFGLPPHLTAATGMDALSHCLEVLCVPTFHPMADGIALEGIRLIHGSLTTCYRLGDHAVARTDMMMAASMGATAFQKGLGLVHALSHPLGAATGCHHGLANAIFMPYVMVYNRPAIEEPMMRLARYLQLPADGFDGVLEWILDLREQLGIPHTLSAVEGMDEALAATLAPRALADPSLPTNPRPAAVQDLERLFLNALGGSLA